MTENEIPVFGKKDVRVELVEPSKKDAAEERPAKPKRAECEDSSDRKEREDKPKRAPGKAAVEPPAEKPKRSRRRDERDDEPTKAGEWNGPVPTFLDVSAT
ncbi:DNA and RNA helicase [Erythrobacter sp. SD-21]|nr:DNA and RNA helicase [Erythrobacter sp. SD-21]